ncbi:hypothetical protein [Nostoc sp. 'Peltigera membranacea cyanobiont' N6]|uniref:hypothetical protein n=1 Tax=Nostoc sp. 'Peltigera membranacea cyanobiont' N6 TaxID=1261031 RepID=UPI000CF302A0|nr:hypothetical protein [Nostoc sp. 'Peltigera membranacea cyanobiont' N6]
MTLELISLKENFTVSQVLERIHNLANLSEIIYYLYITDAERHLTGIDMVAGVSLHPNLSKILAKL